MLFLSTNSSKFWKNSFCWSREQGQLLQPWQTPLFAVVQQQSLCQFFCQSLSWCNDTCRTRNGCFMAFWLKLAKSSSTWGTFSFAHFSSGSIDGSRAADTREPYLLHLWAVCFRWENKEVILRTCATYQCYLEVRNHRNRMSPTIVLWRCFVIISTLFSANVYLGLVD